MKKVNKKNQRGIWVFRHGSPKNIAILQIKKEHVRNFKKDDFAYIPYAKILPSRKGLIHNLKGVTTSSRVRIVNCIFDEVILRIMDDMVETKSTYKLRNGVEFIIGTKKLPLGGSKSFFTFNTHKTKSASVRRSERNGFIWKTSPAKKVSIKLEDYTKNRKYSYIPCKLSIGKQLLASSRGKLDLLMWKLTRKGLSPSSLEQHFD